MRFRFSVTLALLAALAAISPAQTPAPSPTPAPAPGPGVYRFCYVQVRDAGDPLIDQYYGQPQHLYYSAIYTSDDDKSASFMEWTFGHYAKKWTVDNARPYRGINSVCNRYTSLAEAQKALGAPASDGYQRNSNTFTTHTNWPNVPPDAKKKKH